jgi:hypothetical protein
VSIVSAADGRILAGPMATDQEGRYRADAIAGDPASPVRVLFIDASGTYVAECHDDVPADECDPRGAPVARGSTVDAQLAWNGVGGDVIATSGAPLPGIWVSAVGPATGASLGGAVATDGNGHYLITGLMPTPGTELGFHPVLVIFQDPTGSYLSACHDNVTYAACPSSGTAVARGSTNINAVLAPASES